MVSHRTYARVGLLGNPSDGYNGKVISFALANFYAEVSLELAKSVAIEPNLRDDGYLHDSLDSLQSTVDSAGYLGGLQLILATCAAFQEHCKSREIALKNIGFTLKYNSNIPRQCGLSGSSAIVLSCLKCLIQLYDVSDRLPRDTWPKLALAAEQKLGITAGLQDRVIQTHEGLVCMDFEAQHLEEHGVPICKSLLPSLLPQLYLIYCKEPTSSGKIHSTVRKRFDEGDSQVHNILKSMADLADQGRSALEAKDHGRLASLMDQNFNFRRQLFGDASLGSANLRMVELVNVLGGSAKLTGSGGAIVAAFPGQSTEQRLTTVQKLTAMCEVEGFTVAQAEIACRH